VTTPSPRDRTRPAELLIISGVLSIFVGLVVLMSTREVLLSLIFLVIAFIVSLVVLAMLALAVQPDSAEKIDLDEQDREQGGRRGH
jgi:uncharacterized membrane protein HdeD (DUF308 family)